MKKLIPALILLLVSAMVLSTSSYAWFSMNRTVSATGMSLTSTAPANLLIANGENAFDNHGVADWSSKVAAYGTFLGKLYPSSTYDGIVFHAIQDGQTMGDDNIGGISVANKTLFLADDDVNELLATGDATSTGYYVEYRLDFKTTGSSDLTVYLESIDVTDLYTSGTAVAAEDLNVANIGTYYERSASEPYTYTKTSDTSLVEGKTYYTVTGNPQAIKNCVRVALINDANNNGVVDSGETVVGIYAVDPTTPSTVRPISSVVTTGEDSERFGTAAADDANLKALSYTAVTNTDSFTVLKNEAVKSIIVRVWIEGQHTDCKNVVAGQSFNIGLTFKTVEENAGA